MPEFPHATALLLFDGFTGKPQSAVRRSEMESGPPKQLQKFARVLVTRPARVLITSKADYNAFQTWFADETDRGAAWFDFTDPIDGTVKSGRIVDGELDPLPQRKDLERWEVAMRIETWG